MECSHSTWWVNSEVANLKQWHDVKQPKNKTSMLSKPSSPPSLFLSSFLHLLRDILLEGDLMVPVVLSKETCSVLVQIEQKPGDMKLMNPAGLTWRIWADLWEMIWTCYRCNPHPPITSHLSNGVWSHEEVNYCKELQEVLFFSILKINPKSARGKGLYNPYLIVIMYITMDTLINKTMSKSMEVTLKVYTRGGPI